MVTSPLSPSSLSPSLQKGRWLPSRNAVAYYIVHNDRLAWMCDVFGAFTPIRVSTKAENCADIFTRRPPPLPILPIFEPSIRMAAIDIPVYFFPVIYVFFLYRYIFFLDIHMFFVALHETVAYARVTVSPSFALVTAINSITLRRSKNNTREAFCSATTLRTSVFRDKIQLSWAGVGNFSSTKSRS